MKALHSILSACLCVVWGIGSALCQNNQDFKFAHISTGDGLSHSGVFSIVQDQTGFMWFGTRDGLNRFDSQRIKVYKNNPDDSTSLSDNTVNALWVDDKNRLWVGTSTGLNFYDRGRETFTRFVHADQNINSLSRDYVSCIFQDSKKNLWVGTLNGLNRMNPDKPGVFERFFYDPQKRETIQEIFEDKQGYLWIGTNDYIYKAEYTSGKLKAKPFKLQGISGNNNTEANVIFEDPEGLLWIGTERNGLKFFDKQSESFVHAPSRLKFLPNEENSTIRKIKTDGQGNIWVGTIRSLWVVNLKAQTVSVLRHDPNDPESLSDNSIRSIFIDRFDNVWLGTFQRGINCYNKISRQFYNYKHFEGDASLNRNNLSAITEDAQGNLWISYDGGGIIRLDRKTRRTESFMHDPRSKNSLSNNTIKWMSADKDNNLWIAASSYLDVFNYQTRQFKHLSSELSLPNRRIFHFLKTKEGDLWIGMQNGGLHYLKNGTKKVKSFTSIDNNHKSLSSNTVTYIYQTRQNELWIGCSSGLNRLNKDSTFQRYTNIAKDSASLSDNNVLCIYQDSKSRIWIGTRDNGFNLYLGNNTFKRYGPAQGLSGNSVKAILEDNAGNLWISTENGISKFTPKTETFKNYNTKDGLSSKEFNAYSFFKDSRGYIYFGGSNGLVYFHPDSVQENNRVPAVVPAQLRLFNKEIKTDDGSGLIKKDIAQTDTFVFKYNQNVFSIEFAVLNFINPQKNHFAYKLEGFENEWNYPQDPVVTYMNLPAGTYHLLVKGSNNDNVWGQENVITIIMRPAPWKTWWAYTLYVLIVLAAIVFVIRFFRQKIENRKQNELHQLKLRFFTNLSHDLRTPLTLITAPLNDILDTHQLEPDVRNQLQLIRFNANRLLRLFNQLLDFRKQETGHLKLKASENNMVRFLEEIVLAFGEYSRLRNVSLHFQSSHKEINTWFDHEEFEKVIFNLLANAFKFTQPGNRILVSVDEQQSGTGHGFVVIRLEDNGVGIDPASIHKIFDSFYQAENNASTDTGFGIGLALCKGIVEMHKGTIAVESTLKTPKSDGKTIFTIKLPLGHAHLLKEETTIQAAEYYELPEQTITVLQPTNNQETTPKKYKILIVEDNAEIRDFLKNKLDSKYKVRVAVNGQEAFENAQKYIPDLIISDVLMPIMDGITLTSLIKSDERTSHIPIIMLTARNSIIHEMEGLRTGADEYVTKPFHVGILELKINNLLVTREKLQQKYSKTINLETKPEEIENLDEKFLVKLYGLINKNISDPKFNVSALTLMIGMSRPVLFRKVKALTGMSVIGLINTTRMKKAAYLLEHSQMNVSEIAFATGFSDANYFARTFNEEFGMYPSEYMDQKRG